MYCCVCKKNATHRYSYILGKTIYLVCTMHARYAYAEVRREYGAAIAKFLVRKVGK